MIPKIIHFCWFSGEEYPGIVKKCLKSWRKKLPDYTIRIWDKDSFDFNSIPYVKEGMAAHKWAVAADYVRLYALYTEGGIYLDSDVEIIKSFDCFLNQPFFTGTEPYVRNGQVYFDIEGAIIGAEKGHPFLKECLDYYHNVHYTPEYHITVCTAMENLLNKYGYQAINETQHLSNGVTIYAMDHYGDRYCFYQKRAIHWCQSSWLDTYHERGKLYYFSRKHALSPLYNWISHIILKARGIFKHN